MLVTLHIINVIAPHAARRHPGGRIPQMGGVAQKAGSMTGALPVPAGALAVLDAKLDPDEIAAAAKADNTRRAYAAD